MANTQKPIVTAEEEAKAQNLWVSFTSMMKWGTISVIICVALMALFLV